MDRSVFIRYYGDDSVDVFRIYLQRTLAEWATTLRKYNVWFLVAIQAASQLLKIDELTRDQILESSPIRIFVDTKVRSSECPLLGRTRD